MASQVFAQALVSAKVCAACSTCAAQPRLDGVLSRRRAVGCLFQSVTSSFFFQRFAKIGRSS